MLDGAAGVVLVYDICSSPSFEAIAGKAGRGGGLATVAKALAPTACMLLIGTHADQEQSRSVSVASGESFATTRGSGMFFLEVSSVDGTNVDLLRTLLRLRLAHARAKGIVPTHTLPLIEPEPELPLEPVLPVVPAAEESTDAPIATTAPVSEGPTEAASPALNATAAAADDPLSAPKNMLNAPTSDSETPSEIATPAVLEQGSGDRPEAGTALEPTQPASVDIASPPAPAPAKPSVRDRFKPGFAQAQSADKGKDAPPPKPAAGRGNVLARFNGGKLPSAAPIPVDSTAVAAKGWSSVAGSIVGGPSRRASEAGPAPPHAPGAASTPAEAPPHSLPTGAASDASADASAVPAEVSAVLNTPLPPPASAPAGFELVTVLVAGPDGKPAPLTLPLLVGQTLPSGFTVASTAAVTSTDSRPDGAPVPVAAPSAPGSARSASAGSSSRFSRGSVDASGPLSPIHKRVAALQQTVAVAACRGESASNAVAAPPARSATNETLEEAKAELPAGYVASPPHPAVTEAGDAVALILDVAVGGKAYGGLRVTASQARLISGESAESPPGPTALSLASAFASSAGLDAAYAPKLAAVLVSRVGALGLSRAPEASRAPSAESGSEPAGRSLPAVAHAQHGSAGVNTTAASVDTAAGGSVATHSGPNHTSVRASVRARAREQHHHQHVMETAAAASTRPARPVRPRLPLASSTSRQHSGLGHTGTAAQRRVSSSQLPSSASSWDGNASVLSGIGDLHAEDGEPSMAPEQAAPAPANPSRVTPPPPVPPLGLGRLVGRLHVEVGPGATGRLEVHEGDDPDAAVRAFAARYPPGTIRPAVAAQLAELVRQQQLAAARAGDADSLTQGSLSSTTTSGPARRRPASPQRSTLRGRSSAEMGASVASSSGGAYAPGDSYRPRQPPPTKASDEAVAGAAAGAPASGPAGSSSAFSNSLPPVRDPPRPLSPLRSTARRADGDPFASTAHGSNMMMTSRGLTAAISAAAVASGRAGGGAFSGGPLSSRSHSPGVISSYAASTGVPVTTRAAHSELRPAPLLSSYPDPPKRRSQEALPRTPDAVTSPLRSSLLPWVSHPQQQADVAPANATPELVASHPAVPVEARGLDAGSAGESHAAPSPSRIPVPVRALSAGRLPVDVPPQREDWTHAAREKPNASRVYDSDDEDEDAMGASDGLPEQGQSGLGSAESALSVAQQRLLHMTLQGRAAAAAARFSSPGRARLQSPSHGGSPRLALSPGPNTYAASAATPAQAQPQQPATPLAPPSQPRLPADPCEGGVVWCVNARGEPLLPGAALFNLDVDVGGPQKARLVVLQGAASAALAGDFLAQHGLPHSLVSRLAGLVERSARTHQAVLLGNH